MVDVPLPAGIRDHPRSVMDLRAHTRYQQIWYWNAMLLEHPERALQTAPGGDAETDVRRLAHLLQQGPGRLDIADQRLIDVTDDNAVDGG